MISFYPGPSRVHDEIPAYVKDAFKKGILSMNHRSDEFMAMSQRTIDLLREKLSIPGDYTIFYTSSATECWEIIAQSLVTKKSYHLFNGAFGEKWYTYTRRLCPGAIKKPFDKETILNPEKLKFASEKAVICLTQNETANGTQVSNGVIRQIKKNNPKHLVAVDATSSMAGIALDFEAADIWFASVQKCFGLPAGLGLMACSHAAIKRMKDIGEEDHYNSLSFMYSMMEKWQTPFTPNVLNIYLLMRVMEKVKPIHTVNKKTKKRYEGWVKFLKSCGAIRHLIGNEDAHSYTVVPVIGDPETLASIKKGVKENGILLGEGYGDLKATTFRIANFPAIKKTEIRKLQGLLKSLI